MQEELNNNTNMTQCLMSCSFFWLRCFANVAPPFLFGGHHPSGVAMFQHTGGELNESGDDRNSKSRLERGFPLDQRGQHWMYFLLGG